MLNTACALPLLLLAPTFEFREEETETQKGG